MVSLADDSARGERSNHTGGRPEVKIRPRPIANQGEEAGPFGAVREMMGRDPVDAMRGAGALEIYVDADACPVKEEVYRVATRYGLKVFVVSNSPIWTPTRESVERVVVRGGLDVADDWIAERIGPGDIAITADIPLADRCLKRGARVLGPRGHAFTDESIGDALATRELMDTLRQGGMLGTGPPPFGPKDRSRFLAKLDESIQAIKRGT